MCNGEYRDSGIQLDEHHVVGESVNRETADRVIINSRNRRSGAWKALGELHSLLRRPEIAAQQLRPAFGTMLPLSAGSSGKRSSPGSCFITLMSLLCGSPYGYAAWRYSARQVNTRERVEAVFGVCPAPDHLDQFPRDGGHGYVLLPRPPC